MEAIAKHKFLMFDQNIINYVLISYLHALPSVGT